MEVIHKTYAAFVKNTVDPMLDKIVVLKDFIEAKGIQVDRESISEVIEKAFLAHFIVFFIDWMFKLIVVAGICYTVIKVL